MSLGRDGASSAASCRARRENTRPPSLDHYDLELILNEQLRQTGF